jgi:flagellar secretion chaperone FliS
MSSRHKYLEHEVLSAAPQKLQLLLIEGAIRHTQRAKMLWHENSEAAGEAIVRAQEIVAQLLAGLSPDRSQQLVGRLAAVYTFVFRTLTAAHLQQTEQSLDDALRVLEIERETWRQVCQQLGTDRTEISPGAPHFGMSPTTADCESTSGIFFEV